MADHCTNGTPDGETALIVKLITEGKRIFAPIPNILMQLQWDIEAFAVMHTADGAYTIFDCAFNIRKRPKPDDYVYTETELHNIQTLVDEALLKAGETYVPRMKMLDDPDAEQVLGKDFRYNRLYCERSWRDIDKDGELEERGTYARICLTEAPIPPHRAKNATTCRRAKLRQSPSVATNQPVVS